MKIGLGHVLAALALVQCGPLNHGAEDASVTSRKSDPASNSAAASKSGGASNSGSDDPEPPAPQVVPSSPIASGAAEADPRLVVRNAYLKQQYVFLESRLLGSVAPGAEGTFEIPPGAHSVTFSDSRDGRSNRKTLAEVFDSGYAYHYDVLAH